MKRIKFFTILIGILFLISFISANYNSGTYGAGRYGKGVYGIGEVISTPSINIPSSSSSLKNNEKSVCTYEWKCTEWFPQECPASGFQERICINKGTCTGIKGMPEIKRNCTYKHKKPLFDIFLKIENKKICPGEELKVKIKLENYGKIELLDAFMTYWIVDKNNSLVAELKDTRAVSGKKEFEIKIDIPKSIQKGTYRIYSRIDYLNNQTAIAGDSFSIQSNKYCKKIELKSFNKNCILYALIIVILIITIFCIIKKIKEKLNKKKPVKNRYYEYKEKIKKRLKKIKSKNYIIFVIGISSLTGVFYIKKSITGFIINNGNLIYNNLLISFILFIVLISLLFFIYKKRIYELIESKKERKYNNRLKNLINKKVYTEKGKYFGKVKNIIIQNNKIYGLKINTSKICRLKKVIITYRDIKSIKEIVIIKHNVLERINRS